MSSPKDSDILTEEEIRSVFKGDIIAREVIFYKETTSTNDKVIEIGTRGIEGTVVIADSQVQGRGRFGRRWISPPGVNLYFTVLLKPPFSPKEASIVNLMVPVAVVSGIREYTQLETVIKWPNDVLIRDKKVAGILTEMKSDMNKIEFIAAGVGINVNMPLELLPPPLRQVTTSLKEEKGEAVNRIGLLGAIFSRLEYWYKHILKGKKRSLFNEWKRLDSIYGKKVCVKMQGRVLSGIAQGITDNGELIIRPFSGKIERVCSGEVTILKD
jgi:BirA family biotin operon repressor/biotin-[acetyl-CoA-carboxylase] ligase